MNGLQRVLKGIVATLVVMSAFLPAMPVSAASASLFLSPASGSVAKGATLIVSVKENSGGDTVQAVQANLNYPADLLSFVSISASAAFDVDAQDSGGGGSVQIGKGTKSGVSGTQTVAIVRFKALTNSGKATISFAGGSSVASNGTDITSGTSAGTYTLTDPAPTPEAPPADTIPPKITDVKITDIGTNIAAVTWTTSEPATSEVSYGLTKGYGWTAVDANLVTAHKVALNQAFLSAGQGYHYMVKSADGAGNATSANDATFITQGAKALVTVTTNGKKPAKGAKVSILNSSAVTDKQGKATISGLSTGNQTLVVTYQGRTTTKIITVAEPDAKNDPQPFAITVKPGFNYWPLIFIATLIGLAIWFWRRRGGKFPPRMEHIFTHKVKPIVTARPVPTVISPNKNA